MDRHRNGVSMTASYGASARDYLILATGKIVVAACDADKLKTLSLQKTEPCL